jgi:hypothetical protein
MEFIMLAIYLFLSSLPECERICLEGRTKNEHRCNEVQDEEARYLCLRTAQIIYEECVSKCAVGRLPRGSFAR